MVDQQRVKSLETGTGIEWTTWLGFLEPHRDLDHTQMAEKVLEKILDDGTSTSPEWWAQGVTVAFEQHIGRRAVGQRCDGSYGVGASKTIPAEMDDVLAAVESCGNERTEFAGVPVVGAARSSSSEKWRYWKVDLADGSKVSINIQTKAPGTSSAAVNHDGLETNENATELKAFWREFLGDVLDRLSK